LISDDDLQSATQLLQDSLIDFESRNGLQNARIEVTTLTPLIQSNDIDLIISWNLPLQDRENRSSRIIVLRFPRERIEEDGILMALRNGMAGFLEFINDLNLDHDTHYLWEVPRELYIIRY
jgi:hypothetical protein